LTIPALAAQKKMPVQWGLSDPMCEHYLSEIQKWLPECMSAYRSDYAKIYSVMMDKPLVRSCLEKLDKAIASKAQGASPETNWLRFSSILSYFEKKCWFPEDILLPLGVLDAEVFYSYIRRGYVLKDYGAGVKHGEFTHRLQWHALMRVITDDFTRPIRPGWDHSPLELYVSLGMKQNHGIWGKLFDQRGDGFLDHPDSFHEWVLNSNLVNVVAFISKRETKRREAFIKAICDYIDFNEAGVDYSKATNPLLSHAAFKEFEIWFVNEILRKRHTESTVKQIYEKDLTAKADASYLGKKTTTQAAQKPDGRTQPYRKPRMALGPVYSFSANHIIDAQAADVRARNSRSKLQAA